MVSVEGSETDDRSGGCSWEEEVVVIVVIFKLGRRYFPRHQSQQVHAFVDLSTRFYEVAVSCSVINRGT